MKKNCTNFIKQKLIGILLIIIGIITPLLCGDATASVFLIPVGAYLLFTRTDIMAYCNEGERK